MKHQKLKNLIFVSLYIDISAYYACNNTSGFIFGFGKITKLFPLTSFPSQIKQLMVTNKVAECSSEHDNKTTQHFLPNCLKNTKAGICLLLNTHISLAQRLKS